MSIGCHAMEHLRGKMMKIVSANEMRMRLDVHLPILGHLLLTAHWLLLTAYAVSGVELPPVFHSVGWACRAMPCPGISRN